jgi:hypothetical protein
MSQVIEALSLQGGVFSLRMRTYTDCIVIEDTFCTSSTTSPVVR